VVRTRPGMLLSQCCWSFCLERDRGVLGAWHIFLSAYRPISPQFMDILTIVYEFSAKEQ
jgi:hypothetical protein